MSEGNSFRFLGTAGSRWVVARQLRHSGGIFLELKGKKIFLDPGPGALVRCSMTEPPIDPAYLDAIILTHSHIDHCNDVNIMIDGMTGGGFNRGGMLYAPKACLEGENSVVMRYLRSFLDGIVPFEPETSYTFEGISFRTSKEHHHGVETYGLIFDVDGVRLSFLVDTRYYEGLADAYKDSDILVIYVTFLDEPPHPKILHLGIDDVRKIISAAKPKKVILTHFGMTLLDAGPERVAAELSAEFDLEVIAAMDGMVVPILA